jgi:hypothetical protein
MRGPIALRLLPAPRLGALALGAAALGAVGCGDNIVTVAPLEATSGLRLKLVGYHFDDGTLQWRGDELFDATLHTRCTRRTWIDGVERCVPLVADAVYTDAGCTMVVGRGVESPRPKYFLGHDELLGERVPARLYRAGAASDDAVTEVYRRRDGACEGPFVEEPGSTYYAVGEEIAGATLVSLRTEMVGTGRIVVRALAADDGLLVPLAFEDGELAVDCRPQTDADGRSACAPASATTPAAFADPTCTEPVVAAVIPPPSVVRVDDASGCSRYHGVGASIAPPIYRRVGAACELVPPIPGEAWRAVGEPLALAPVERELETSDRRLGRMVVRTDDLYAIDGELFDRATRTACQPLELAGMARCVPTPIAPAVVRYHPGCALELRVVELPAQPCARIGFALAYGAEGYEVRVIGDPVVDPVYEWVGVCRPYVPPPGIVVHALGAAIPPEVFAGALPAEDR